MKKRILCMVALCLTLVGNVSVWAQEVSSSADVLKLIEKANDYWQSTRSPKVWAFWDQAAYYTGNMEAYKLTGKAAYYDYSYQWCEHNNWRGANSNDKKRWRWRTYGEGQDFVLFGDWQICFQTYIDMYHLNPQEFKVARAKEVMSYMCSMHENKFWWWADALYMVMPVMTKLYKLTGDVTYLDVLHANFLWSDSLMYDAEAQLYYRDAKYIYPKVKTASGGKSFWARGDGWVLAGLAKVLADMPEDYKNRGIFVQRFKKLAEGVARCQRPGGYWSRSMLCEEDAPGYETSGTGFFAYGLMWGVNHGYLDKATYAPVIEKAWNYLEKVAMQEDGSIGYVQPIGEKPDPTRTVNAKSQAPFGTGAWLLAACERVRYLDGSVTDKGQKVSVTISNPTDYNRGEVVELDAKDIMSKLGLAGGYQLVARDGDKGEIPYQLTHDGKLLVMTYVRPNSETTVTFERGIPSQFVHTATGRLQPNREQDLSWENDRNGWRAYGPHIKGIYGLDIFNKNVPDPMLDAFYHSEITSYGINNRLQRQGRGGEWAAIHRDYTYHRDHGHGMDAYVVGATLGTGAPALLDAQGNIQYQGTYEKVEFLDIGPLRFSVRMTFPVFRNGNVEVQEERVITLDKGTHLNKCEVTYHQLEGKQQVLSGIVVHKSQPKAYKLNKKAGYVAYADAMDHPEAMYGEIYTACMFPNQLKAVKYLPLEKEVSGAVGHVVGVCDYTSDAPFTYYFGAAWSKYDVSDFNVWETMLKKYADNMKQPLQVVVK